MSQIERRDLTMVVKLKIETKRDFNNMYWELRKAGLLESVTVNDITLPEKCFPIEIPVNIDGILKLAKHPAVKPYKKMIDENLSENVKRIKPSLV